MMTIDSFNKLTGQETLHPLVGMADGRHFGFGYMHAMQFLCFAMQ